MDQGVSVQIVAEAVRLIVILGLPIVFATLAAGVLCGVIQSATSIHEPIIGYAAKIGAVLLVLYFMLPSYTSSILALTDSVFR